MYSTVRGMGKSLPDLHENRLKSCGACRCLLKAKVHFSIDVARTGLSQEAIDLTPKFCWLTKGMNKNPGATGINLNPLKGCGCSK